MNDELKKKHLKIVKNKVRDFENSSDADNISILRNKNLSILDQKKCAQCGGNIGVTYQRLRAFYSENGEIVEDTDLENMHPPEFVVHCLNNSEDQWYPNNLSKEVQEELYKWEDAVKSEVKRKFF
jgi:hypothetical protein